jgi:hypothetical protein
LLALKTWVSWLVELRYNEFTALRAANLGGQEWRK